MKNVRGIWLPDDDNHISMHLERGPTFEGKGTYQFAKIEACIEHCRAAGRTGIALDVGAHVGTWSRVLAKFFDRVIAFEPMPHLFECLARNVAKHENVAIVPRALSNTIGRITMQRVADNSGNCRVAEDDDVNECVEVDVDQIDNLALPGGVDFIKIDVEGYEPSVLTGGRETIQRDKPLILIEQKAATTGRYGYGQFTALELLKSWGMKEVYYRSGDHLMEFDK